MSSNVRRTLTLTGMLVLGGLSAGVLAAVVANLAPTFDSKPYPVAEVGQVYRYAAHATDPDGNDVTYSLGNAPAGMAWNDAEGAALYTPTAAQVGTAQVTVRARDTWGASVDQTYTLRTVADYCEIYPITVPQSMVANVAIGDEFTLLPRGTGPGNFSWLTWAGGTDAPTLATSLTPPGNSYNYANPNDPSDHLLEIGNWAQGATGSMNAYPVREQMDVLKTRDIIIPTWDAVRAAGADFDYRVVRFATVRIRHYDLTGKGAISFEFRGYRNCYNDPPKAANVEVTTPEDTAVATTLLGTDPENDTLTYTVLGAPAHGTLSGEGANLTYTPDADFFGDDVFTYRANDGEFDSNVATVTIHVTPVNDPPVATDIEATAPEDTAVALTLVGSDPENDALTYTIVDGPTHGLLTGDGAARTYTPELNWSGTDTFTYRVNDGGLDSNLATATIHVTPVNDPPTADSQSLTTPEDTALAIVLTGADPEGDALAFNVVDAPAHGMLSGEGANRTYTPTADFHGTDTFTFRTNDGALDSSLATVTIVVTPVNDAPAARDLQFTTPEDVAVAIVLEGSDPDGDALTYALVDGPQHGTLSGDGANLTYTPEGEWSGVETFTYRVNDGELDSNIATVTIHVTPVNDPPVAHDQAVATDEDTPLAIVLTGDDADGDALTYTLRQTTAHGELVGDGASWEYRPARDFFGLDHFTFIVNDGQADSTEATVWITVREKNAPPVAVDLYFETIGGEPVAIVLTGSDPDGDAIDFRPTTTPGNGVLSGLQPNLTFVPDTGFFGTVTFQYVAIDGRLESVPATVTIVVSASDDNLPPQIVSTPLNFFDERTAYGYDVDAIDPDAGDVLTYSVDRTLPGLAIDPATGLLASAQDDLLVGGVRRTNLACRAPAPRHTFDPVLKWGRGIDPTEPVSDVYGPPLVGYLTDDNGDGRYDQHDRPGVVVMTPAPAGTSGHVLVGLRGDTGVTLFTSTAGTLNVLGSGAIGDVDVDGVPDIAVLEGNDGRYVSLFSNTGVFKWRVAVPIHNISDNASRDAVAIADLDADGTPEIIRGATIVNGNGTLRCSGAYDRGGVKGYAYVPVIADVDRDGKQEIVAGRSIYNSQCQRVRQLGNGGLNDGYIAIGNFDVDADPEYVLMSTSGHGINGKLSLLDSDGTILKGPIAHPGGGEGGPPTLANVDNDPFPEIGIAGENRYAVFDNDLKVLWSQATDDRSSRQTGSTFFDFEGDGFAEVVYGDEHFVYFWDGLTGAQRYRFENNSGTTLEYPVVADIDGDHSADVITGFNKVPEGNGGGLRMISSASRSWPDARPLWTQHAFSITNVNDDGSIPRRPEPSWLAHNTYRLNKLPKGTPLGQSDLALFDLRLDPADTTTIRLTATNRGLAPTDSASLVRIYDGNGADGRLLGTMPLPTLASGESLPVVLHGIDPHALGDSLFATIDEVQAVAECDEGNNAMQARVLHLRATDRAGLFDRQVATASVLDVNDAPTFEALAPVGTPHINQLFTHTVRATDPDRGDGLIYSIAGGPVGVEVEPVSGEIRWKPTGAQAAIGANTHTIVVKATDLRGLSATQSVTVTVPPNRAPVFVTTSLKTATKGLPYVYDATATDPDADLLSYTLLTKPSGMTIDANTGEIRWTPSATGNFTVTLRATDANNAGVNQSYTLAVTNPVNHAPVFDTDPLTVVALGQRYEYDARATDPDGHALQYLMVTAPAGMTVGTTTGSIVWQPRTDQIGAHAVTIKATDPLGLFVQQSFTVYVTQGVDTGNHPPAIRSMPSTAALVDDNYLYEVTTEDIDGDAVTLTLTTAPAGMTLDSGKIRWTPTATQAGLQSVVLTASDGRGGTATQSFSILVSIVDNGGGSGSANHPPSITTDPLTLVVLGQTYRYYPAAIDSDGDTLTYSLLANPAGMTVNATTGVLAWTPPATGTFAVSLRVADGRGGFATQSYSIVVNTDVAPPINHRPILLAPPFTQGKVGVQYCEALEAFDADGDPITFSLTNAPAGATIDSNGRVCFTPIAVGSFPITARVSDGQAWTEQSWALQVVHADTPLDVGVVISPERVTPGAPVTIEIGVTGPAGPVVVEAVLNDVPVVLDEDGTTLITAPTIPGYYQLEVTVTDGIDTTTEIADLFVADPSDTTPPAVSLTNPTADQRITAPTPVLGQVSGDGIARWTLSLLDKSTNAVTPIAEGHEAAGPGSLGTLDPTLLMNGYYVVVLQAWDASGNSALDSRTVLIDGDMKLGHFSLTFEDASIPLGGFPLRMTRTYDTRRRNERLDFGYGWSVDYQNVRITESRPAGYSWTMQQERNGYFGNWCVRPNGDPIVAITLPDGSLAKFKAKAMPECQFLVPQTDVQIVYEALPGTDATLAQTDYQNVRLASVAGTGVYNLLDLADPALAPVDPKNYRLTLPDGTKYSLTQGTGLRQITAPDGNTLTYSRSGVKHSLGLELRFLRDGQGRIETVVLPDGKALHYTYTLAGDLEMALDKGADITSFTYLPKAPHYLEDIIDPRGVRVSRNEYDDNGRLIATIDADENRIEYTHDLGSRTEIIKDRRGNASIYGYDEEGRVIAESNALGETIRHEYDDNGNELKTIDPLGHITTRTFDARGNVLTETNHLGEAVTRTYDSRNAVLTEKNALGQVVQTNTHNPYNGYLVTTKNAAGELTQFGYDSGIGSGGSGTLLGIVDPAGQRTKWVVDLWGHHIQEIDDLGNTTSIGADFYGRVHHHTRTRKLPDGTMQTLRSKYTLDAKDRITATLHPDGTTTTTEYDGNNKPTKACDALQRCTVTTYNVRGEVARVDYPDGTYETSKYDENGNTVEQRDRGGRITKMEYDKADRLEVTILPDGTPGTDADNPRLVNEYDDAGRLTASIDARGKRTEYGHDDADRRTTVTDALGRTTTTRYNALGQREAIIDALGRETRFEYDLAGRLTTTIHPDETALESDNPRTVVEYDAAGRKVAEIDEEGRRKELKYDGVGRVVKVTLPNPATGLIDSGALVTTFGYDEVGNKLTQTDALGRVTRWTYDKMGRELSRTLPLGQVETFGYNELGQRTSHTAFKGVTTRYGYDTAGRMDFIDYATDADVITTYLPGGERESVTDGQGTTLYTYTARGQLEAVAYPDGNTIRYEYDASGNKTALSSPALEQVFHYDDLNRLQDVDSRTLGGPVRRNHFEYNEVGSRKLRVAADGTTTTYDYDVRNRLRTLATRSAARVLLFGAVYTVDDSGLRTGIAESNAAGPTRSVGYDYDSVKRLEAEVIMRPGQPTRVAAYTYDAVGNRLRRETAGVVTTYEVDDNDRLIRETEAGVTTLRTYDDNGNTTYRSKLGELIEYKYNEANRLVGTLTNGGDATTTGYSADGIRNRETANGVATSWLINSNRDHAQTLEAYRGGQLSMVWQFGDDLMAQANVVGGNVIERSLLADGMGSVRQATNASGSVTDSFEYDAFGEELAHSGMSDIDHRYRSEQVDPNIGLYNLRARWYDPSVGRFINQDTWLGTSSDPISLHKYLYANSNPANYFDPTGHASLMDNAAAVDINGILQVVARGERMLEFYDKVNSAIDLVIGLRQLLCFFEGDLTASLPGTFPPRADFTDAAQKFVSGSQRAFRTGSADWIAGYIKDSAAGRKFKAYVLYMPSIAYQPSDLVKSGIKVNGKPVMIGLGGPKNRHGSLAGFGVVMGKSEKQLARMDLNLTNPKHKVGQGHEMDAWDEDPFSFHVYDWRGGPR